MEINEPKNIRAFREALSNQEGKARFYHIDNAPNSYSLGVEEGMSFEEVDTITLDKVIEREKIERVDAIKLDVEGVEEYVLQGSRSLLSRMRPLIVFEISEKAINRVGLSKDGAWKFLQELGYEFFAVEKYSGKLVSLESPQDGNAIAIPKKDWVSSP